MADNASSSKDDSSKNLPEGMRVVRKRRKRSSDSHQTLFLKKKEILREMHSEEGRGAIGLKEQLSRLKTIKEAQQDGKPVEERWGDDRAGQRGLARILLWVFALLVPVLAIVTAFVLTKGGEEMSPRSENQLNFSFNVSEEEDEFKPMGPRAWFENNPHDSFVTSIGILDRLNQSADGRVPDAVFRREDFTLKQIADRGLGWASRFTTTDPRKFQWSIADTEDIGYLVLEGLREDQSTFRSYFVKSEEGLRMDWAASTAWSEVSAGELATSVAEHDVTLRCFLNKKPHYDSRSDQERSWYLITVPGSDLQFWGFVPAGSSLDEELLNLFQFGRFILDRKEEVRVIARVSKPVEPVKENQFEIVELVTEEWVLP
ncbi:MAG: hypothetical protein MK194_12270 [Roseibacillus sp.]|nr:hypothetical protein [Roseibacillus sp.]